MQAFLKGGERRSLLHRGGIAQALIYAAYFYLGAFGGNMAFSCVHLLLIRPGLGFSDYFGSALVETGNRLGIYGGGLGLLILFLWCIPGVFGPVKKGEGLCFTPVALKAGHLASICLFTGVMPEIGRFFLGTSNSLI